MRTILAEDLRVAYPPEKDFRQAPAESAQTLRRQFLEVVLQYQFFRFFRVRFGIWRENREAIAQFREQVMKRPKYVLQGKSVDGRDFVIVVFTAETSFAKPGIYFIGGCIGVRDAGYPSRGISDGFDAV